MVIIHYIYIYFFNIYILKVCVLPDTILGVKDTEVNKVNKSLQP